MKKNFNSIFPFIIPIAVGFLAVIIFFLVSKASAQDPGVVPAHPEIEERFGIQFTTITLTGETGMVDLRYKVLDVGKAKNFGHYTETTPMIIEQESGKTVETAIMGFHNHRVEPGRTYYLLYRNTANAIERGTKVTIKIDTMTIEDIVIR